MSKVEPLFLPVGSRVRVRLVPDASASEQFSDAGTVISSILDDSDGPAHVAIALDRGGFITRATMSDWEIIPE